MNNLAPRAGLVPLRNCSPIDFDHGRHQRALSAIARQNASPVLLRSLFVAELFPGFAASEVRQYFIPCKLDPSPSKGEGAAPVSDRCLASTVALALCRRSIPRLRCKRG